MTNPNILWRESFGYGGLVWDQVYLNVVRSSNTPWMDVQVGRADQLLQWGRGSGGDEGWAMRGNPEAAAGLRATTLGFSGAINTNAVSNNKVGVAFAYNQGGNVGNSVLCEFIDDDGLGDGSFSHALLQLSIETLADGRLCACTGVGSGGGRGTIIGISPFVLPVGLGGANGAFTHIEIIQPVIHATTGSVQVYANGILVLNISGAATRSGGSGKIGYISPRADSGRILTDLVIHDCANAGRIGDKRVSYRAASVAGTYTAGVATGAGTLLGCVSEQAADGDTTYIQETSAALPKKVSFTCQAMPANTVSIDEVTEHVIWRKTDASANTGRYGMKSSATEVDNGSDLATPSGYNLATLVGPAVGHQLDPNGNIAWTIPHCDAVEIIASRTA